MEIKVAVAAHKPFQQQLDDEIYQRVQVGVDQPIPGFLRDNQGQNISDKNPHYSELTALYWLWKNGNADYLGLVHYRRYFSADRRTPINKVALEALLKKQDIVLPKKRHYFVETNESHFVHAHPDLVLETTRKVIQEQYPEYTKSFERVMHRRSAHMFNMMVMSQTKFDAYCQWLFDVLSEVEQRTLQEVAEWDTYEQRAYGFVSELLLDVWLDQTQYGYVETPVWHVDGQHWPKRIVQFLGRKFGLIKNKGSF